MTNAQLRKVMMYYLDHMNGTGDPIAIDTVHKDILAEDDGPPSSKNVYRGNVSWSLSVSGNGKPKWPADWMDKTVAELADVLVPAAGAAKAVASKTAPDWFKAVHSRENS